MDVTPLADLHDPRLEPYRHLKTTNLTRDSGRFIAEGKLVVERLLASRFEVESLLLSERRLHLLEVLPQRGGLPVLVVPEETAVQLLGFHFHAGVLACGRRAARRDLDAFLRERPFRDASLIVACPHMTDPDNLGSLIRLGRALGIEALLLGSACCDPFSRRTLRVSMGNAFELPIVESRALADDLRRLREEHGYQLSATVVDPPATPLHLAERFPREVLLLGNEAHGLPPEWVDLCDRRLTIPMQPGVDSLNVTLAAGICLYWLQHGRGGREAPTTP